MCQTRTEQRSIFFRLTMCGDTSSVKAAINSHLPDFRGVYRVEMPHDMLDSRWYSAPQYRRAVAEHRTGQPVRRISSRYLPSRIELAPPLSSLGSAAICGAFRLYILTIPPRSTCALLLVHAQTSPHMNILPRSFQTERVFQSFSPREERRVQITSADAIVHLAGLFPFAGNVSNSNFLSVCTNIIHRALGKACEICRALSS